MQPTSKWLAVAACAALATFGTASTVHAQETAPPYPQVLSVNPFGLLAEYVNAEYERAMTSTTSLGVSASYFGAFDEADYFSLEGKYRYYPQARSLAGFALGGSLGYAQVSATDGDDDKASAFSVGVEVDYNWLVGPSRRFFIGTGIGAKRLFGGDVDSDVPVVLPTLRLVNVGFAF